MDYQKITLILSIDNQDFRDILMSALGEIGFESFVENESDLEAYIPSNLLNEEQLMEIDLTPLFSFTYSKELIIEQNWNEVWEKNYFKPLLIANKCLVRAPFHTEFPTAEFEIIIEPKMAFGTGNHETTTLIIEHILDNEISGKTILDMGCGTGILSMLASKKGAKSITAIDFDKWAFESTIENCTLNNCNNVKALLGDASLLGNETFDLIFANIHKNILIEDMEKYYSVLNSNGILIMSGFYEHDMDDITLEASKIGLSLKTYTTKNSWTAATYSKQ